MANEYLCPKCKSKIKIGYPDIECFSCGWSEPLINYPISWDWHRRLCREYGLPDPGSCELPEHSTGEFHERILALEESHKLIEKPKSGVDQTHEKPQPKLYGGVKL